MEKKLNQIADENLNWVNVSEKLPTTKHFVSVILSESTREEKGLFNPNDQTWSLFQEGKWNKNLSLREVSLWRPWLDGSRTGNEKDTS